MIENKTWSRKCIASNQIVDISELIRVCYDKNNNSLELDLNKNKGKRGAYFIPNEQNWNFIKKTKAFNRTFRTNITPETYDKIEAELKEVLYGQTK
ncbi:YlxR family protein [Mycoplasma seminis]|uniref:YlxR family protein n=1 Tax=Mycoplasma seminis TaxID=512749 RepID=A0ABY9HAR8_9MOLU|nr:YlxR family protein [Mycoplasma seminis]WLP85351.1 YlxR family protein [Mycoplasma seminis]